jgi:hypothetical protein
MFSQNAGDRATVYKMMERDPALKSAISRASARLFSEAADRGGGGFLDAGKSQ